MKLDYFSYEKYTYTNRKTTFISIKRYSNLYHRNNTKQCDKNNTIGRISAYSGSKLTAGGT